MWFLLASFIFGTIIGSFANVFVLRYGTGRSLKGRSSCGSCGTKLSWYELIPVVSWLVQKGRCRSCGCRISPQYLIVELVFGAVFAACAYSVYNLQLTTSGFSTLASLYPCVLLFYLWTISFLLISIALYDIRHMIIPDGMLYALGAIVVVWTIGTNVPLAPYPLQLNHVLTFLYPLLSGPLVALPFFLLWLVSRGRWMGFGDIKLSVVLGWMLGLLGGFSALVFGVWAGALVSVSIVGITRLVSLADHKARSAGLVSRRGGLTMKSEIPFGPFLVAGALFVLLTGVTLETIVFHL